MAQWLSDGLVSEWTFPAQVQVLLVAKLICKFGRRLVENQKNVEAREKWNGESENEMDFAFVEFGFCDMGFNWLRRGIHIKFQR